ncbi:putative F-box domain-containing protein [Helianthus annuus]|uniref:putative F-box protein At3g16590 n=1 Tax=Helianthus annuus TaxID=4232 RepID=UPI000B909C64|nr:putative F-box protein At3g16590 [Helianthus annuus]KAJ0451600.1 putative F-box domain-containing protein [Helianthus annuus]KAJ0473475.1 putative F-box domain-containing protein [Helianthus annuus]KAJ0649059.1 putative F-box domain-containing protein [Helianthus annuus]KAJ0652854.1 putative F-box domain-containing protein [Helianthus annuus]KAJ0845184.1 putative F-box domain-containing protein [Helianthus annuus]
MSDNIPFELQSEIMKRLPAESLIRFRSVCKSWKSLIHSSDFIAGYRGQQHLIVRYKDAVVNHDYKYVSIVVDDDDTFPLQKVYVTDPQLVVNMLKCYTIVASSHGLLCLFGKTDGAIIWNPSIRKAVAVGVPNMANSEIYRTVLGFGVCCKTNDPKIVKINYIIQWTDIEDVAYIPWQVEVFTLSTGAWRSLSNNLPGKSIRFGWDQVVVDGCLYWLASVDDTFRSDCFI